MSDCLQGNPECKHEQPNWTVRRAIIPGYLGFVATCDQRLLSSAAFKTLCKIMQEMAVAWLKNEGVIEESYYPDIRPV